MLGYVGEVIHYWFSGGQKYAELHVVEDNFSLCIGAFFL